MSSYFFIFSCERFLPPIILGNPKTLSGIRMAPSAELAAGEALKARAIPSMVFSDGSVSSMTPPPKVENNTDPTVAAKTRFSVKGNAVVTGGAGTLGLASCEALLDHGLEGLMIFDTNLKGCQEDMLRLRSRFPQAKISAIAVNVTDEEAVNQAMEKTVEELGSVDHVVCFVGVVGCIETIDMPVSQWRRIIDINTTGCFICAQAGARQMVKNGKRGSSITFVASISAHRVNFPQPQAAYNVSKAALLMLKSCLAAEWARYGIRTNSVSPGYMDTILNEGDGIAQHRQVWAERNPIGRMGSPSELTGTIVLLASDAGSYINGTDIVVDGGGIVL